MLLTTVAQEKAKYVNMLKDWFIGLCLLFLMHYIMAFSVTLVNKLTNVVKTSVGQNGYAVVLEDEGGEEGKLCDEVKELGKEELISTVDGKTYVTWPTNLMGNLRLKLQLEDWGAQYIGYGLCFVALCLLTVYFTVVYAKRLLHMAFLTLIAPMVALTYCIDKINDGQAQGFNKWLKEYIFNLLIQPMHLLLYYILVTSAFELAGKNVIYSLVALGFMIPAEKLLRGLFGFEKASTAPALGPAGAMMAASVINGMLKGKNKAGKNGKGDGNESEDDKGRIRGSNAQDPIAALADGEQEDSQGGNQQRDNTQEANDQGQNEQGESGQEDRDYVLDAYRAENGRQNDNGEYYDMDQDEFRDDYDPHDDPYFQAQGERLRQISENQNQGEENQEQEESQRRAQASAEVAQAHARAERFRQSRNRAMQSGSNSGERGRTRIKRPATAFGRAWKANMAAQKAAIKNAPKEALTKIANSHPLKTAGKVAAGAVAAGAIGAVAVPAAITSGDLGNLPKGGFASGATAYAVGSGRAEGMENPSSNPTVRGVHNDVYERPEYDELALETYIKNYLKDIRNRNYFEQRNDKREAEEMFKRGGEIETYLKNEITSVKEMQALHQLIQDRDSGINNKKQAIAIQQLAGMVGSDTNKMNQKNRDDWQNRIEKMAEKNGNIRDAKEFAAEKMEQIDKFYDIKSKL